MFERLIGRLDLFPGGKTYALAALAAILFWGQMVGLVSPEFYAQAMPWITGAMAPTVALKMLRQ